MTTNLAIEEWPAAYDEPANFYEELALLTGLPEKDIRVWRACTRAQATDEYVREGRRYAKLSVKKLKAIWKSAVNSAARRLTNSALEMFTDAAAEFGLRGRVAPYDEAKMALEAMRYNLSFGCCEIFTEEETDRLCKSIAGFIANKRKAEN